MPVVYPVLSPFPAPEDFLAIELAVEVHQPLLEPLEHAADLAELNQVIIDLTRDRLDLGAQRHLLGRLAPPGFRLRRYDLVTAHQVAPLGMQGDGVGHDALRDGKGP